MTGWGWLGEDRSATPPETTGSVSMSKDPDTGEPVTIKPYEAPSGGWGSVKSLVDILPREGSLLRSGTALLLQNKPNGFVCPSCAWAKPEKPNTFEFCENGAKATAWEMTPKTVTPAFFRQHTVSELLTWPDYNLEEAGRLTHPMRYDPETDRYRPVSWGDAFAEIGRELRACDPKAVVLYLSGRASLEASYMYALFGRLMGTNNFPDSSNMCHESTSVALPASIGSPVGTVDLEDFEKTDCIMFFGQNVGTSSPRMLHQLQDARKRGVPIITFNPLKERGLLTFTNPQSPTEMLSGESTRISTQYHQVKAGGDLAAVMGLCKAIVAADDAAIASGDPRILDVDFIATHTHGFEDFAAETRRHDWADLERQSGLTRKNLEAAAAVYMRSSAVMGVYGMGLTQHRTGVENCQMLVNLLLLRGNIGKAGAGICPVRGHSNVQGQRTVGITEKPELVPMDKLRELYKFEPPHDKGLNTVEACEGILKGEVKAFIGLGGNFIRAIPETDAIEAAWSRIRLSVQISTKLNRAHLIRGEVSYILPCLARTDIDLQKTGKQAVAIEDSTAFIHGSRGVRTPVSKDLLSEPRIVAEMAKATLPPNPHIDWDAWCDDYALVRDKIEATYPEQFKDFNARMFKPGGFPRPVPARNRVWKTKTGKANFIVPRGLDENPDMPSDSIDVLRLMTLRSNDQFNTTIYGYDDRFRGVKGTRKIVFMNQHDIDRLALKDGDIVTLTTVAADMKREVSGLRIIAYDIPEGCCGGYYPECNPLIPLWHHAEHSKVPAAKSIPVTISLSV